MSNINKTVIEKSLTDAINKSHQHLRLPSGVIETFNKFHDKTCGEKIRKTELGLFTDSEGNEILTKRGGKTSITWDTRTVHDAFKEHGELHMTHNHPRTNGEGMRSVAECLSTTDIDTFLRDYTYSVDGGQTLFDKPVFIEKSISCESPNGSRMTLVRGDKYKIEDYNDAMDYAFELSDAFFIYEGDFFTNLQKMKENYPYDNNKYNYSDYCQFLTKKTINKLGRFEDSDKFKSIQKDFRRVNLKLTMTYPSDYNVVYNV